MNATSGRRIAVLMGGVSGEHSISLRSAASVLDALRAAGHQPIAVGIDRRGRWLHADFEELLRRASTELAEVDTAGATPVALLRQEDGQVLAEVGPGGERWPIDFVFPVLHGPGGEDGTIQGLLEALSVPFAGAGCMASALAIDKLAMKHLCHSIGIAQTDYLAYADASRPVRSEEVEESVGFPCFVKPSRLGSSVGISRVDSGEGLAEAVSKARRWDHRIVIERAVAGREIEVAMLGDIEPEFSPPGEIVTGRGFYDFSSKYVDDDAGLLAPTELAADTVDVLRRTARQIWKLIGCHGFARADFFLESSTGRLLFNELNTIPGFTEISMFPRLWACAGLEPAALVGRIVELGLSRSGRLRTESAA